MVEDIYVLGFPPRRERRPLHLHLRIWAKRMIVAVTLLLLASQGAAIVAAPFLVPALWWWGSRSSRWWGRAGLALLAGLVMAEVGWIVAYSISGERQPFILGVPSLWFVGTIVLFYRRERRPDDPGERRRASSDRRWPDIDAGAGLAFLLAASMTATTAGVVFFDGTRSSWLETVVSVGGCAAASAGLWAWAHRRWPVAAGSFFLSLAWPGGFGSVATWVTVPFSMSFVIVAIVRARRDRRARWGRPGASGGLH